MNQSSGCGMATVRFSQSKTISGMGFVVFVATTCCIRVAGLHGMQAASSSMPICLQKASSRMHQTIARSDDRCRGEYEGIRLNAPHGHSMIPPQGPPTAASAPGAANGPPTALGGTSGPPLAAVSAPLRQNHNRLISLRRFISLRQRLHQPPRPINSPNNRPQKGRRRVYRRQIWAAVTGCISPPRQNIEEKLS